MSLHITKFVDRIKANESRGQAEFHMTMSEAKDLHADITKLLLLLNTLHEINKTPAKNTESEVILSGGAF
jgi:hypothetical protein